MKTHPLLTRSRATALVTALALAFGPGGLLPGFTVGAASAAPVKKGGATVTLNFVNAEIEGVARAMAVIVDKQIMVDPRVKGAITLYSDQPLTPREAYLNFLAALRGQGFSVVEVGNMLKIVPEAEAKLQTRSPDGALCAWNTAQRGERVWALNLHKDYKVAQRPRVGSSGHRDYGFTTSPFVRDDWLLVEVGAAEGTVIAFDKRTGKEAWRSPGISSAWNTPIVVTTPEKNQELIVSVQECN